MDSVNGCSILVVLRDGRERMEEVKELYYSTDEMVIRPKYYEDY